MTESHVDETPESDEETPEEDPPVADDAAEDSSEVLPVEEEEAAPVKPRQDRLDTILSAIMWTLGAAVLIVAVVFAYNVYQVRLNEASATPALRLVENMKAQVRTNPNDAALRIRLGEALGAVGKYAEAVEQFENALKIEPDSVPAYLDLGLVAIAQEDFAAAERFLLRVVQLTDESEMANVDITREAALYNLGLVALERTDYEDAVAFFKNALRIRKDASDTYYNLAQAFAGLDEIEAAQQQLLIAFQFDPNYAEAHFLMGELYLAQDNEVKASEYFAKSAELAPDVDIPAEALAGMGTPEERIARARTAQEEGDMEVALINVSVARNVDSENFEAAELHGQLLVIVSDTKGALVVYREALEIAPEDAIERIEAEIERLEGATE